MLIVKIVVYHSFKAFINKIHFIIYQPTIWVTCKALLFYPCLENQLECLPVYLTIYALTCPGPWYGSCPRITTRISSIDVCIVQDHISSCLGNIVLLFPSCSMKSLSFWKYGFLNSFSSACGKNYTFVKNPPKIKFFQSIHF